MVDYIEPTDKSTTQSFQDELAFYQHLVDKDIALLDEENSILKSVESTPTIYNTLKMEFSKRRATRAEVINEERVIAQNAKAQYDSYIWRTHRYAAMGVSQGNVDLIETLPNTALKNQCVLENEVEFETRDVNNEITSWLQEQELLNYWAANADKSKYLQAQFVVAEQRELRNRVARRAAQKRVEFQALQNQAEVASRKLNSDAKAIREQKLAEHYKNLLIGTRGEWQGKLPFNDDDFAIVFKDLNIQYLRQILDIRLTCQPSFRILYAQGDTSVCALSFKDYREFLDLQRLNSGTDVQFWYPTWKLTFDKNELLSGWIVPSVATTYTVYMDDILRECFPFTDEVAAGGGADKFPKFVDYGDKVPFPNTDQLRWAVRKYTGWNTEAYRVHMEQCLKAIFEQNVKPDVRQHIYIWPHDNIDMELWYSERPKTGFCYIPKIGWINPYTVENTRPELYGVSVDGLKSQGYELSDVPASDMYPIWKENAGCFIYIETPYAVKYRVWQREEEERKRRQNNSFDPIHEISKAIGTILKELNPIDMIDRNLRYSPVFGHFWREIDKDLGGLVTTVKNVSNLSSKAFKGEPITPTDLAEAFELALKVGAIILAAPTGGATLVAIGVMANQLKKGPLGKSALGNAILSIGEAIAIAQIAETSISAAVEKVAENQVKSYAISEGVKAAGKSNKALASIIATALVESVASGAKGAGFTEGLTEGATSATKAQVKAQAGGDIIWGAGTQLYEKGGVSTPSFSDLSMPSLKNISLKDIKISAGSGGVKAPSVATVTTDYLRKKLVVPEAPKAAKVETEAQKKAGTAAKATQISQAKAAVIDKLSKGQIPSGDELKLLHPEAEAVMNQIKKYIPESQWAEAFNEAQKIGFPSFNLPSLSLPGVELPTIGMSTGVSYRLPDLPSLGIKVDAPKLTLPEIKATIKGFLPIGVALESPITNEVNFLQFDGTIKASSFKSPYEHSMLSFNLIPRQLNESQRQQRLLELQMMELQMSEIDQIIKYNQMQV